MRIIDCKSPVCQEVCADAPRMIDYLCEDCDSHFNQLTSYLDKLNIKYAIDPNIVRGLDYYTKTVFEITSDALGAQSTVCGGGRYNGLVEELGGKPTPGIGFAMGIERLILILKSQGIELGESLGPNIFVASIGDNASLTAQKLVYDLRNKGLWAERDLCDRSVKAQMKYANKLGACYSIVIGDDEVLNNKASLKNMGTGEETVVELSCDSIYNIIKK